MCWPLHDHLHKGYELNAHGQQLSDDRLIAIHGGGRGVWLAGRIFKLLFAVGGVVLSDFSWFRLVAVGSEQ